MRILAIDPGAHTGIATQLDNGIVYSQMVHNKVFDLWKYMTILRPEVVIVERFQTGGRFSNDMLHTVEVQGSVYSIAWMLGADLYLHRAADRTPFLYEARQMLGANKTKIQSHSVDALAHLLRWKHDHPNYKVRRPEVAMTLAGLSDGKPAEDLDAGLAQVGGE